MSGWTWFGFITFVLIASRLLIFYKCDATLNLPREIGQSYSWYSIGWEILTRLLHTQSKSRGNYLRADVSQAHKHMHGAWAEVGAQEICASNTSECKHTYKWGLFECPPIEKPHFPIKIGKRQTRPKDTFPLCICPSQINFYPDKLSVVIDIHIGKLAFVLSCLLTMVF